MKKVLALDIGGTNIRCAVVLGGKIKKIEKAKTPKTKAKFLDVLTFLIGSNIEKGISNIGVGFPSAIINKSMTTKAPNLPLQNFPLGNYLSRRFRRKVILENDASCVALAEAKAGSRKKNLVAITLGTGIGSGIIINGKIYSGMGLGGEVGHMVVNGEELEFWWKKSKKKLKGKLMSQFMVESPMKARKLFLEVGNYLGPAIASVINILDPEEVVLAGGPRECGKRLLNPIVKETKKYLFLRKNPTIRWSKLEEPGIIGASLLT